MKSYIETKIKFQKYYNTTKESNRGSNNNNNMIQEQC